MNTASSTTVIIAIPGGQETRKLSLAAARAARVRGEIEPDHWAWSPLHNDWKQVAELPELQIPAIAPATRPITGADDERIPITPGKRSTGSLIVKEEEGFGYFKLFVILLMLVVIGIVWVNYSFIDQPLRMKLAETSFATVPVHAHLGAFLQPNILVIHLLPNTSIGADNLADFFVSLAESTPKSPLNQRPFELIGFTSAWTSQYVIVGSDWQSLGQMQKSSNEEKKAFILAHMAYPTGEMLFVARRHESPAVRALRQERAWGSFTAQLVHP